MTLKTKTKENSPFITKPIKRPNLRTLSLNIEHNLAGYKGTKTMHKEVPINLKKECFAERRKLGDKTIRN